MSAYGPGRRRTSIPRVGAFLRKAVVAAAVVAMANCTTPQRMPAVPAALAARSDPGFGGQIRYMVARGDAGFVEAAHESVRRELAWRASRGEKGPLPPANMLAISGGGDDGAFTAGLLNGWTARGDRPEFKAVTGVSTGALIAPFAFLGPRYDSAMTAVYTTVSQRDIFKRRGLLRGIFDDALSDTTPLMRLTGRYVNQAMLDEIAAEYAKGRVLLVGTTNLDTREPVVWNMTAIAASKDPRALELFRKILVASSAIPGAFPPVMIDVQVDGVRYQEMHVDGGAMAQVFAYPPSLHLAEEGAKQGIQRTRRLYVIRNSRLDPEWASTRRRTLNIATRAISSLMQTQGIGDLYRIYLIAERDQVDYNLAFIPATFTEPHTTQFDTTYMRKLYQTGYDMGVAGYPWRKTPPGYDSPVIAAAR